MNRNILMSLVIGFCVGLSFGVIMSNPYPNDQQLPIVENNNYIVDTVEVIEEDNVKWYTLDTAWYTVDTIKYESIDTTVIYWPSEKVFIQWGKKEFYYFKYKES